MDAIVIKSYGIDDNLEKYLREKAKAAENRSGKKVELDNLLYLWNQQDGKCALTGLAMTYTNASSDYYPSKHITNASIDRINPDETYTKENMQLVCRAANHMKYAYVQSTFIWLCKLIAERFEDIDEAPKFEPVKWYENKRSDSKAKARGKSKTSRRN